MKISSPLRRSASVYPSKSLLIDLNKNSDDNDLDYKTALHISNECSRWIANQLEGHCFICTSKIKDASNLFQSDATREANIDIVVAYLSGNSPELVLMIMASLDITISTELSSQIKLERAMLNARWTSQEIASVLRVSSVTASNSHSRQHCPNRGHTHHVTLLLFGDGFEGVAHESVTLLQNLDKECNHSIFAASIPMVSSLQQFMARSTDFAPISRSNNFFWGETCDATDEHSDSTNDDAFILFTSGTTSPIPKGVRLSHTSLFVQGMAKLMPPCSYDEHTSMLATVPFFHVGGFSSMISVIMAGGTIVFPKRSSSTSCEVPNLTFSPATVLEALTRPSSVCLNNHGLPSSSGRADTLVVVPAMLHSITQELSEKKGTDQIWFSDVRLIVIGGHSAPESQLEQVRTTFPHARVVQTYACTEAGSSITFSDVTVKDINSTKSVREHRSGHYVGIPPPHIRIGILKTNSKDAVLQCAPYEIGHIATYGLHIMKGYWRRNDIDDVFVEHESRSALPLRGWLKTNDVGYLDENGGLFFCGRASDAIRTGGETVFPMEVEELLSTHDAVEACAVFGLPDDRLGEMVSAAIVLRNKSYGRLLVEEARRHCKAHNLAGYKCPRAVFILPEIPRNTSGKVLKHKLAEICGKPRLRSKL